jgi:hypothetical protein
MGMYDTYGDTFEQLKVGECALSHYRIGDKVSILDGIYFGHERAIVIVDGVFLADMPLLQVYDNYGDRYE